MDSSVLIIIRKIIDIQIDLYTIYNVIDKIKFKTVANNIKKFPTKSNKR
jgi:hypothetical protein